MSPDPGPPPVLSDGVLTLRLPRMSDAEDVALGCQDAETTRWTTVPTPYSLEDAQEWLAAHADASTWWANPVWGATVMPSDRWAGSIDLRPDGSGGAEIGYLLAPWGRGRGHGARMLRLVCAWAFSALGLEVITWYAYAGNRASLRSAQAVGFQIPDHVFRRYAVQRGTRRDSWIGTLTPTDLAGAAAAAEARAAYAGPSLTKRELVVLSHLVLGQSNRAIAAELRISENTVKNHVRSILEKLQAKSRSEAVVAGLRNGLVSLPG